MSQSNFRQLSYSIVKQLVTKENYQYLNQRNNFHFTTIKGEKLQQRVEFNNDVQESFLYIVKNGLPILTDKDISSFGNKSATYQDSQKRYHSKKSSLEVVSINEQIVKIDFQNKKAALSCDFLEDEWECLCSLE